MTRQSERISAVFGSAGFAFIWLSAGYIRTGLLLYLASVAIAYRIGLFRRLREWPLSSKVTLACGPPLVALGWFFSTVQITYTMLIPILLYAALSMIGGMQLRKLNSDSE